MLIVESRDEVFGRLAADLALCGLAIERAETSREAYAQLASRDADLVLANREFSTDESGWLLVSKWALDNKHRRIWLYTAWPTAFDEHWRTFTKVERLLYYGGDVWLLSELILAQLAIASGGWFASRRRAA
ncbi:MAG: hypothetical protein K2Y37_25115 [Pirellulales bacterium]|nr:hypothetical protein [Pirellulales bacterium]